MADLKNMKGGAELQKFLDQLPAKVEANVMRAALRAGAKVIEEEAKRNVPVDSGDLRDSIRVSTRSKRGTVTASVKAGNKKAWYWRFVEFGTAAHSIDGKKGGPLSFNGLFTRSVMHPGARAKPFMRPALDAKANEALEAVGQAIAKRLTKRGLEGVGGLEVEE